MASELMVLANPRRSRITALNADLNEPDLNEPDLNPRRRRSRRVSLRRPRRTRRRARGAQVMLAVPVRGNPRRRRGGRRRRRIGRRSLALRVPRRRKIAVFKGTVRRVRFNPALWLTTNFQQKLTTGACGLASGVLYGFYSDLGWLKDKIGDYGTLQSFNFKRPVVDVLAGLVVAQIGDMVLKKPGIAECVFAGWLGIVGYKLKNSLMPGKSETTAGFGLSEEREAAEVSRRLVESIEGLGAVSEEQTIAGTDFSAVSDVEDIRGFGYQDSAGKDRW